MYNPWFEHAPNSNLVFTFHLSAQANTILEHNQLELFQANVPFFHLTFTCSKSTIESLEKGVKYVQSYQ